MPFSLRTAAIVQLLTTGDPTGSCASRVACCDFGSRTTSASSPGCELDMRHMIKYPFSAHLVSRILPPSFLRG
jgi:hypothetical protein